MTVRGALIGCGFFAENHLPSWWDLGIPLVAVCDRDGRKAEAAAGRHGIGGVYTDAEDMLRAERLDFVDIVTTVETHRPLVELAARHGVAAICQKPFACSLSDADAMIEACDAVGVKLMVHENFRWQHPMLEVRKVLDAGGIGAPFFARISFRHDFDIYARQPYLAEVARLTILDVGIHLLDLAGFYMGEVASLSCQTQRINPKVRGEDVATLLLRHTSGATTVIDISNFTHRAPCPFPQTTVEIDGAEGSLRLSEGYRLAVRERDGVSARDVEPEVAEWMEKPWHCVQGSVRNAQAHWLEALSAGTEPATSGRANRRVLELTLLAYAAAATGQTVATP